MPPKRNLIVVDGNYLCYRAFHTTGMLRNADQPTGVLYGFFVTIRSLAQHLGSRNFAFCFDYGKGKRQELYPDYKRARRERKLTEVEERAFIAMREQTSRLRERLLHEVGFRNVCWQPGYEADDLIARCVSDMPFDQFTIVSGDADLYQLLSTKRDVMIWNPVTKLMLTEAAFTKTYGVRPDQWAWVKACAGCTSDGIKGVKGVGEKGACNYLAKKIDPDSAKFKLIQGAGETIRANLRLTKLPLAGCTEQTWTADELSQDKWATVAEELGFRTLPRLFDQAGFGLAGVKR